MEGNPYLKYPELGDLRKAGYFLDTLKEIPGTNKAKAVFVSFNLGDIYEVEVEKS